MAENPKLVKQIYINLDGESEIEGMLIKNRTIYTTILSSICLINGFQDLKFTGKTFKYGNGYKLDSNVNWLNDNGKDVIFLKQQIVKTQTVKKTIATGIPGGSTNQDYEGTEKHTEDVDTGTYYSPLDIVAFIDYTQEKPTTEYVPVIFLKSISDEEEWIYINRMIRIGIDVAAVILGVATLGSFSGFWAVIAGVDIALAGLDAIVQANYDEIKSASPEGEKFLEAYEKFILAAGVATSIPLLASAPSVLAGLAKLTSKTVAGSRNFVRAAITRAILEINIANFTKNTVKEIIYGEEALKLSGVHFNTAGITRLQEQGVLFIKGIDFDGKVAGYAAIYKGEVIAQGTAKQVRDILNELWTARGVKLIQGIEEIFKNGGIPFLKGFSREKILAIAKGLRPDPSKYLTSEYIVTHLKKFENGASYLVPKSALDRYGREIIGRADGQFVMSNIEMDKLLENAKGNISYIEKELGIPSGWWENTELVRIDIKKPSKSGIRIPTGNENGANDLWLPGGRLPTGYVECVLNAIPKGFYKETILKFK